MMYVPFPKIPRLNRDIVISEKIDGTNACIYVPNPDEDEGPIRFGSRNRWVTPESDNFGFAKWASQNMHLIDKFPPGWYFGEWWGLGIQRGYDIFERRFSVFNLHMYAKLEDAVGLDALFSAKIFRVPILYEGPMDGEVIKSCVDNLRLHGSWAADYDKPEGIIVYHTAARAYFKVTLENDDVPKGKVRDATE